MSAPVKRATIADLAREEGKAELLGGRIVHLMPTGRRPSLIAGNIYRRLHEYASSRGIGEAHPDNVGYAIPELPSGRESFSPDVSYYVGRPPVDEMDFLEGPPAFAVEVRSKHDYGRSAEAEMAAKREDYFQAGTEVVWDVDPMAETVSCYRKGEATPTVFGRGELADAEPAVPGWRLSVDEIFA